VSRRAPAISFIFITLLLDVLGIGLIIPVGPKLILQLQGGSELEAAPIVGLLAATYALMQFLFAPILGALSDRFGRRPVLLISMFGSGLDYFAMALVTTVPLLFVTRIINGLSGASISAASAYITDVTPPEKRAAGFGIIGAAFGLGFVLGPLMGGILGDIDVRYPFYAAALIALLNGCFGLFVLPESLPKERRNKAPIHWNPARAISVLFRYPLALRLALALFLINTAQFALHATWFFYCSRRYGWSSKDIGFSLFAVGIGAVIIQGGLARRVIPKLGEWRSLLIGVLFGACAYIGYAISSQGWMIFLAIAVASLGGIAMPACQSLITKSIKPTEQGAVQGSLASVQSLANITGPLIGSAVYGFAIRPENDFPGLVYFMSAALALLSLLVIKLTQRSQYRKERHEVIC
jgi:DHA1 family tetracycline resistance protein-like MFS transporter